jgi:hypothetical protein
MFERLRAAGVGALAGITAYAAWLTSHFQRLGEPDHWRLSGPVKWFILGGALLGFLGGLSFVENWLEQERGEVFENTVLNALLAVFFIAMFVLVFRAVTN